MPSFAKLQEALSEGKSDQLVFFAFDLLIEGKEDCRPLPLTTRKEKLKALLDGFGDTIRYVEHFESTGNEVWLSACKMNLEGIVSKRLDAPYVSGRRSRKNCQTLRTSRIMSKSMSATTMSSSVRFSLAAINCPRGLTK